MTTGPNVVLLCCGSFNPITNMHLRMFEIARDHLQKANLCRVVGGIVSPVHDGYKKKDLASASHRCTMIRQALASSDWIRLDSWECQQNSWLETLTVLRHHQSRFDTLANSNDLPAKRKKVDSEGNEDEVDRGLPNNWHKAMPIKVKLLCGADLLESFSVPNLWKEQDIVDILTSHGLVVISRTGSNPHKFIYESDPLSEHQSNIHVVTEWITNEISATKIRRALRRGDSVRYLLHDTVIDYIKTHNLYGVRETEYRNPFLTPSPSQDAYPPSYELVKSGDVADQARNATATMNTLSVPVATHSGPGRRRSTDKVLDAGPDQQQRSRVFLRELANDLLPAKCD